MIALALALAYLGSLAFLAFAVWRRSVVHADAGLLALTKLDERLEKLESAQTDLALPSLVAKVGHMEQTVTALAIGAGLRTRPVKETGT